jgi:hypothetical protein
MEHPSWRAIARKVITATLADLQDQGDPKRNLAYLDARYPFGERANYPYKVWLEERNRAIQSHPLLQCATPATAFICRFCKDRGCLACGQGQPERQRRR